MKVQVNDSENSQKELIFELPYEMYIKGAEEELNKLLPTVKISGFREGKAPKDIVRKQYSHKIKATTVERIINSSIQESIVSNGINPLSQPYVTDVVFEEGKPITFKAKVDVFPEMNINKYSGYDFDKVEILISEEDVANTLAGYLERHVTVEPVIERKDVIDGDVTVIDFVGKIEGVPFDGGTANNYSLTIGSGQFIPGFEDGVIGMKIGESKDIPVTFPNDYGQEGLAGKPAVFTVTLHEIKKKITPELNDETVKNIDPKSKTVSEFESKIKRNLKSESESITKFDGFSKMLSKIVEENPFDIPLSFVKEQAERLAYNSMTQFYQMGLEPEKVGITFEMMIERHLGQAKEQVKQALVINEIARLQDITVEDDDVDKFLSLHAELQDRTLEEIKNELIASNRLESIKNDVLGEKVHEYLNSVNNIIIKQMSRKEWEESKKPKKSETKSASSKKTTKTKKTTKELEVNSSIDETKSKKVRKTKKKNEDGVE